MALKRIPDRDQNIICASITVNNFLRAIEELVIIIVKNILAVLFKHLCQYTCFRFIIRSTQSLPQ